jgi:hypothetical protein
MPGMLSGINISDPTVVAVFKAALKTAHARLSAGRAIPAMESAPAGRRGAGGASCSC